MYVLDAGTGRALWVSEDHDPHAWVARHASEPGDASTALPLPYDTTARWTGPAGPLPLDAPQLGLLSSRTDDDATVLELHASSPRDADVMTLHADRPVEDVTISAGGHTVGSAPDHPDDVDSGEWPYELRFYDPPPEGIAVTLRLRGAEVPRISLSDYTVGLDQVPGFQPRPDGIDRSPDHSSDLLVVGRIHSP